MPPRRPLAVLFLAAWLAHACRPGWSQIVVPERVELGQPIVAECQATAPEGGMIAYKWRGDAKFRRIGSGAKAHVWATAGEHAIECIVATYRPERSIVVERDGKPTEAQPPLLAVKVYKAKFSVGPPKPPEPPKPLNELVDAKTADDLAVWLTAFSHAIVSQRWETGGVVREALADQAEKYGKTNNAAWPVIWGRVEKVTPDGPLDRLKVLAEFDAIIKELGGDSQPNQPDDPEKTAVSFQGFQVLVLEPSESPSSDMRHAIGASEVRRYLDANTAAVSGAKGWRFWDSTPVDEAEYLKNAPSLFKELWKVPRPAGPVVVIANKGRAKAYPWTFADAMAFVSFLKTHGGP